jgi:hypothetical protein
VYRDTGRLGPALDLASESNSPCPRVEALICLAAAELARDCADEAGEHASEALSVATDIGYRVLRAEALTILAGVSAAGNHLSAGARLAAEAVHIQRETGHRLGEARALRALASCVDGVGGARHRDLAERILAEIGACLDANR